MTPPITASFRWSAEEFLAGHHMHMCYSPSGRKFRSATRIWGPGSIIFGITLLVVRDLHPMGFVFVFLGVVLLLIPLFSRRILLKRYDHRPDRGMLITWGFLPGRIESKTDASSGTMEWQMISRIVWSKQGFLLYPTDQLFHWIPVHAFRDETEAQNFAALAKSKVPQFEKVD